mmetsp:Transcript_8741/g.16495  ORF Transcript_8741/g.16495 Transcript_8741/m.16495 type:complete len:100 (+) Transcript_8741:201-500(+)
MNQLTPTNSRFFSTSKHGIFASSCCHSTTFTKKKSLLGSGMMKRENKNTLMCWSILNGEECPHGANCNYAHSEKDLRIETYGEANMWGLVLRLTEVVLV